MTLIVESTLFSGSYGSIRFPKIVHLGAIPSKPVNEAILSLTAFVLNTLMPKKLFTTLSGSSFGNERERTSAVSYFLKGSMLYRLVFASNMTARSCFGYRTKSVSFTSI